jgi:centrin-3
VALRALGFEYKKPEILKLLKENDKNNSNRIEFAEFNKLSTLKNARTPLLTLFGFLGLFSD